MEYSLENLFNIVQNYNTFTFNIFKFDNGEYELNDKVFEQLICLLGFGQNRIETRCNVCNKRYPFSVTIKSLSNNYSYLTFATYYSGPNCYCFSADFDKKSKSIDRPFDDDELTPFVVYLKYLFICTNCNRTYQMYVRVEFDKKDVVVQKIGQYPSQIDVEGYDFDVYKSILNKISAYVDFKKSHLCFVEGFYVGAFAYLRRVFEKMLFAYVGNQKLLDNHISTKIEAAKSHFSPDILSMLKPLYELLSISIHELDEGTSKEYYEYLVTVIEIQLQYEKSNKEKENKLNELSEKINKFKSDVKLNKNK